MQRLILMRHAKTEPWSEGIDDHARALTPIGHEAARAMGQALKAEGWTPAKAIVSTARRTRETWSHLSKIFGTSEMVLEEDLYLAGERGIADIIADQAGASSLIIIGHNPGLHDLALSILREAGSRDHQAAIRIAAKLQFVGTKRFAQACLRSFPSLWDFLELHNFLPRASMSKHGCFVGLRSCPQDL